MPNIDKLDEIIRLALEEDIGSGDVTTLATVGKTRNISGKFIAKQDGIVCGLPVIERIFELVSKAIVLELFVEEGSKIKKGDILAQVSGPARSILSAERVSLNFLQHLSGIATKTSIAVEAISGTNAVISDTRKTIPGLRSLEKYAVRVGGGTNHRFNLSDGIIIKDNHIKAAGGITNAVKMARKLATHTLKIEVEVETFEQIREALACGVDIIMLDNMSISDMEKAVSMIDGRAIVEASGNMGEKDLLAVAKTGVDIISIGALTHSVAALDITLKFDD
jgi:nicotinate-nucleotide pyrophosphorylase (carboxylating)